MQPDGRRLKGCSIRSSHGHGGGDRSDTAGDPAATNRPRCRRSVWKCGGRPSGRNPKRDVMSMSTEDHDGDGFGPMALMVRSFQLSRMLQVAAALELADRVADGPRSTGALATESGAEPSMLLRLCRALAAFGVFAVDDDEQVSQTNRSAWLRRSPLHAASRLDVLDVAAAVEGVGQPRAHRPDRRVRLRVGVRDAALRRSPHEPR